jgi:arginase family enzyme
VKTRGRVRWRPPFQRAPYLRAFSPTVRNWRGSMWRSSGIPFDTGVTYRPGARFGPAAVREHSSRIEQYHPPLDVDVTEYLTVIDYGDTPVVPMETLESYQLIEETIWDGRGGRCDPGRDRRAITR